MRRYRFQLESVLRVRKAEEEEARQSLAMANARLRMQITHLESEIARYRAIPFNTGAMEVSDLVFERFSAEMIDMSVLSARRSVEAAASHAGDCHVKWSEASRRVAALERLDSRRQAEYQLEEAAYERAEVDDMVTSRFLPAVTEIDSRSASSHGDARSDREEVLSP